MMEKEVGCMKKINKVIKIINIISVILVILMICDLVVVSFLPVDVKDAYKKNLIEDIKGSVYFFIFPILILSVVNFKNLKNDNKEDKISVATVIISIIIYSIIMSMSILFNNPMKCIAILSPLGIILQIIRLIFIIQNNRQLNLKNN